MNITKFKHACLVIEKDGRSLVIDPGGLSDDFVVPRNTVAVVVTHEHFDHLNKDKLQAIIDAAPDAVIYAHESITGQLSNLPTQAVRVGTGLIAGNFRLQFYGGEHAVIHKSMPVIPNLGVIVDEEFYYPGDSFSSPEQPVRILALPVSAPWMKMGEAMDFITKLEPKIVFPTHDAILSNEGKEIADKLATNAAEKIGAKYQRLELGQRIEL